MTHYGLVSCHLIYSSCPTPSVHTSSLELNIHQLILSDLASNVGEAKIDPQTADVTTAVDLVTSKVETRAVEDVAEEDNVDVRVFMVS